MKIYVKNMVCERCVKLVKDELDLSGINYRSVKLGEVETTEEISTSKRSELCNALQKSGFELVDPVKNEIIEKLKNAIRDLEGYSNEELKTSFSDYISLYMNNNFISLNTLFSEIEGITIEKYIIRHKIERVKEMLVYEDMDLAEISRRLHYSNTTELDRQFKSLTGLTPYHFRELRHKRNTRVDFPECID